MTVRKISSARGDMSRKIMLRMLQERLYKINENEIIHKDHTPLHTLPLSSSPSPPPLKKSTTNQSESLAFFCGKNPSWFKLSGLHCTLFVTHVSLTPKKDFLPQKTKGL